MDDRDELLKIFHDVCSRGAFILQKDVQEFESALAHYSGARFCMGVGNATDALEFAWMSLGLRPGDEVILCSHTMLATASAIKTAGGVPVPVELGYDGLIDPDAVEDAITPRTVGIMPTQLNGRTCDMNRIMDIARRHRLFVVEDAAQALGSRFMGQHAGTFGNASAISFFPAKVLGSLGDGGAFVTNDETLLERAWQLHDHGRDRNGEVRGWGRNSRLDNIQAAILNYRLKSYGDVIKRRRHVAKIYDERLSEVNELQLPPGPSADDRHFDVYQNYEIQAERRDPLREFLRENGVGTLVQWGGKAIHQWPGLGFNLQLPRTEKFFERCIMLPMNTFVTDDEIHYICDTIFRFYRS